MTATELHQESPNRTVRTVVKPRLRTRIASVLVAVGIMGGIGVTTAMPAQATTSYCGNGRCTVYLDWNETVDLTRGKLPRVNTGIARLNVPITVGLAGHMLIAKGWVWRGNCVAFTASIRPWETQGMFGWRCR